ncbi:MAG: hypothetical protein AAF723_03650 [Pseudomonadota bacterium]
MSDTLSHSPSRLAPAPLASSHRATSREGNFHKVTTPSHLRGRMIALILLSGYILFSPAWPQVFQQHNIFIRPWVMFSGVGEGVLKGEFILTRANGAETRLTPLEVAGLTRYPVKSQHYRFDPRVRSPADIKIFAQKICSGLTAGDTLSYVGYVGYGRGWSTPQTLSICGTEK